MQAAPPEIRTTPRPRCLLCGAEGQILYQNLVDPFFEASGKWNFKRCPKADCSLVWLDPAPVAEDLHLAYQEYFTHGAKEGRMTSAASLRSVLYGGYKVVVFLSGLAIGLAKARG